MRKLFSLHDKLIEAIYWPSAQGSAYVVGRDDVEKITVEYLKEENIDQPWFMIWKNGKIDSSWNAKYVEGVMWIKDAKHFMGCPDG